MLRFKILASAVPLMIAAVFARGGLLPGPHPCIAVGETSLQIASVPWRADLHVSFTDDPAFATVRVQISDSAEAADFAVVDDVDTEHARFERERLSPGPLRDFKHDGKTLARFFFVADPDGYKIEVIQKGGRFG